MDYISLLATYGKPIILVIISGRPRLLHQAVLNSKAVLNAYVPGPKGGLAIAEVLAGTIVPSGRLPYRSTQSPHSCFLYYTALTNHLF